MKTVFKKLNRIFDKTTKLKFLVLLIAIIVGGLVEMLSLAFTYPFLNLVLDYEGAADDTLIKLINDIFGFNSTTSMLIFLALALAVVYIARGVYLFLLGSVRIKFISRKQAFYSKLLLSKILKFSYLYHTHKNIAEIQRIINEDVAHMFKMLTAVLVFLADFFMAFFMMAYLLYESPVLTACVLALAFVCMVIYFLLFRNQVRRAGIENRNAKIGMNKAVLQLFGGIKEVKVSRRESYFEAVFSRSRDKAVYTSNKYQVINLVPKHFLDVLCFGGAFVLLAVFIGWGADVSSYVPQLALFVLAAFRIMPAISRMAHEINTVIFNRASIDAVYTSLYDEKDIATAPALADEALAPQSHASSGSGREAAGVAETTGMASAAGTASTSKTANAAGTTATAGSADIEIRDLSFSYPGIDEKVLDGVSFTIPENKSVALVGPSGVGKTTLADLILGILTPDSGTILYKGQPIYNNEAWNKNLGYIPQQIYLLDEDILANVAFGVDKKDIDEGKARKALEHAQLLDFIETLPDGTGTVVGDRGVRLSGGQRQRIGIARALYEDPPFLVLDEATSSLDTETEKAVMDAIKGFHGNKTILIIAHRLSTIEHCDIVYRVENKTVARER